MENLESGAMKRLAILVVVIAVMFGVGIWRKDTDPSISEEYMLTAEERVDAIPQDSLEFWSGYVIVGDGDDKGRIELLAGHGKTPVTITADEEGIYYFNSVLEMEEGASIRLQGGDRPPLLVEVDGDGREFTEELWPVPSWQSDGSNRQERKQGRFVKGLLWVVPLPEYEKEDLVVSRRPVPVEVDLDPIEIDLVRQQFTDEELEAIKARDLQSRNGQRQNVFTELSTAAGIFRIVASCDQYSLDPNGKSKGGRRCASLQLPDGRWVKGCLGIKEVLEVDGEVFLICRHHILRYVNPEKMERVVELEGFRQEDAPFIQLAETKEAVFAGRYLPVNRGEAGFAGLLGYLNGSWVFYPYEGSYSTQVESMTEEGSGTFLLTFSSESEEDPHTVRFDSQRGVFTDL